MVKCSKILLDRDYFIQVLAVIRRANMLIRDYNDPDNRQWVDSDIKILSELMSALYDIIKDE